MTKMLSDKTPLSRRSLLQILSITPLLTLPFTLGCGGGGKNNNTTRESLSLNQPTGSVALDGGRSIGYLGDHQALSGVQTFFWGVVDTSGFTTALTQTLQRRGGNSGVRTQYDERNLPVLIVQEDNGAFLSILWGDQRAVFKFFQPDGSLVGGSVVTPDGDTYRVEKLAGTQRTGYFSGRLLGLTDAIISFNLTSDQGMQVANQIRSRSHGLGTRQAVLDDDQIPAFPVTEALKKLVTTVGKSPASPEGLFAVSLLDHVGQELKEGTQGIGTAIVNVALTGAMIVAPFTEGGKQLLQGLVASVNLLTDAQALVIALNAGEDIVARKRLNIVAGQPDSVLYASTVDFTTPAGVDDTSRLVGIAAAREFNNIGLTGVITADDLLTLTGTGRDGDRITLSGHVVGDSVQDGQWLYTPGTGPTRQNNSGTWNAQQSQPGSCMVQQNSGEQGIFSQSYDLQEYCGTFDFQYETYTIPDTIEIFYEGKTVFQVGPVGANATVPIQYSGASTVVTVVVTAPLEGTAWNYTVGCPQPTRGCR